MADMTMTSAQLASAARLAQAEAWLLQHGLEDHLAAVRGLVRSGMAPGRVYGMMRGTLPRDVIDALFAEPLRGA